MTTYAYVDRAGCIGFGEQIPAGTMVIARCADGPLLRRLIATIAHIDRGQGAWVVPGMAGVQEPEDVLITLGRFQRRTEQLLAEATAMTDITATEHAVDLPDAPASWRDVIAERRRQVAVEGWTPEHDDQHRSGEMARAAAVYALNTVAQPGLVWDPDVRERRPLFWPWSLQYWKPKDKRRDLVRAAALLLAEIERIDRARLAELEP